MKFKDLSKSNKIFFTCILILGSIELFLSILICNYSYILCSCFILLKCFDIINSQRKDNYIDEFLKKDKSNCLVLKELIRNQSYDELNLIADAIEKEFERGIR
jgi:hypothetical protein